MRFVMAMIVLLGACASTSTRGLRADHDEPVLLARSGAFELHLVDGKVIEFVPTTEPGGHARLREIQDLGELKQLYANAGGTAPSGNDEAVQINGWAGLECVRAGEACGPAPENTPRVMVLVRWR